MLDDVGRLHGTPLGHTLTNPCVHILFNRFVDILINFKAADRPETRGRGSENAKEPAIIKWAKERQAEKKDWGQVISLFVFSLFLFCFFHAYYARRLNAAKISKS